MSLLLFGVAVGGLAAAAAAAVTLLPAATGAAAAFVANRLSSAGGGGSHVRLGSLSVYPLGGTAVARRVVLTTPDGVFEVAEAVLVVRWWRRRRVGRPGLGGAGGCN